tara:strand:+ start:921 stop:1184 length:264 start_codon:yes stop_codon:yes gene_type:complete
LNRSPNSAVGSVALTHDVVSRIHADLVGNWPVDDEHWPVGHCGGEQTVHVEGLTTHGLHRCENHWKIFGTTASHYSVNRNLLYGARR